MVLFCTLFNSVSSVALSASVAGAGRYDNPMPLTTIFPSHGLRSRPHAGLFLTFAWAFKRSNHAPRSHPRIPGSFLRFCDVVQIGKSFRIIPLDQQSAF